jgi:hypothetical protein
VIIEKGVEMIDLCEQLKKVLKIIDLIFYESGNHMIIIAEKRGHDTLRVCHEEGKAIDLKAPLVNSGKVFYRLKASLGINFTVKRIAGHWHVEYTPLSSIRFVGFQERLIKPALPSYTDPVTRSSFLVPEGRTLIDVLRNVRERFENKVPI